jgi:hypothetical protein
MSEAEDSCVCIEKDRRWIPSLQRRPFSHARLR